MLALKAVYSGDLVSNLTYASLHVNWSVKPHDVVIDMVVLNSTILLIVFYLLHLRFVPFFSPCHLLLNEVFFCNSILSPLFNYKLYELGFVCLFAFDF